MVYTFINESIEAILGGLSIQDNDRVLTICSCAQPFGMLEFVNNGSVLAVDNNPGQIKFAKRILRMIKRGDEKAIHELNLTPKDKDYFIQGKRLEKIAGNSEKIKFELRDVEQTPGFSTTFTRGYFSNVPINLPKYADFFEKGALVYVTYASTLLPFDIPLFLRQRELHWKCKLKDIFEIDEERTRYACKIESERKIGFHPDNNCDNDFSDWTPVIFVKK
jgi:hypothetical protein